MLIALRHDDVQHLHCCVYVDVIFCEGPAHDILGRSWSEESLAESMLYAATHAAETGVSLQHNALYCTQ